MRTPTFFHPWEISQSLSSAPVTGATPPAELKHAVDAAVARAVTLFDSDKVDPEIAVVDPSVGVAWVVALAVCTGGAVVVAGPPDPPHALAQSPRAAPLRRAVGDLDLASELGISAI